MFRWKIAARLHELWLHFFVILHLRRKTAGKSTSAAAAVKAVTRNKETQSEIDNYHTDQQLGYCRSFDKYD